MMSDAIDPDTLRRDLAAYPTGVVAVCALIDGATTGMAVNSFTSISLEPPYVSVSVARTSRTWPVLARSQALGLSVLGDTQESLCRQLSARDTEDRLSGSTWERTDRGALLIESAALWMECSVASVMDGGDHLIVLLRVEWTRMFPEIEPLVFHHSRLRPLNAL